MSEQIIEKLNKMHTDIKLTNERLQNVVVDVADHRAVLYGNGREGLKIKVDRIETSQQTAHKLWLMMVATFMAIIGWVKMGK
jgi:uncharacterized protein YoxC